MDQIHGEEHLQIVHFVLKQIWNNYTCLGFLLRCAIVAFWLLVVLRILKSQKTKFLVLQWSYNNEIEFRNSQVCPGPIRIPCTGPVGYKGTRVPKDSQQ
eukprot:2182068-Rhodomonas_salina.1